mgnify:CR=1 FL=1
MNLRPSGYEPDELPGCSTPRQSAPQVFRNKSEAHRNREIRNMFLTRFGGDLLSHVLRRSTIGAEGFHGRVRDGIGCLAPRHGHQVVQARLGLGGEVSEWRRFPAAACRFFPVDEPSLLFGRCPTFCAAKKEQTDAKTLRYPPKPQSTPHGKLSAKQHSCF